MTMQARHNADTVRGLAGWLPTLTPQPPAHICGRFVAPLDSSLFALPQTGLDGQS